MLDFITGERKCLEQRYLKLYGKNDYSREIEGMKRTVLKKYLCLSIAALFLIVAAIAYGRLAGDAGIGARGGAEIRITRPAEGESTMKIPMRLEAFWGEDEKIARNVVLIVRPEELEDSFEIDDKPVENEMQNIESEISKLVKLINRSYDGKELILPTELSEEVRLVWREARDSKLPMLAPVLLLTLFIIYQNRYSRIKKMENDAKEGVIIELPDFINKLVLLLNAGLVFTTAFDRILTKCGDKPNEIKSYFYQQLLQIDRSVRETNSSLIAGLKEFAGRSGVRELTRAVNIISDNIDKGAELASKLQGESELLWLTKKKLAEEKGRIAETKLTFPLVMLLLALIMVTVAPALMEM